MPPPFLSIHKSSAQYSVTRADNQNASQQKNTLTPQLLKKVQNSPYPLEGPSLPTNNHKHCDTPGFLTSFEKTNTAQVENHRPISSGKNSSPIAAQIQASAQRSANKSVLLNKSNTVNHTPPKNLSPSQPFTSSLSRKGTYNLQQFQQPISSSGADLLKISALDLENPLPSMPSITPKNFLAHLSDDLPLSTICLPGSHDAGVYRNEAEKTVPILPLLEEWAVCQYGNLKAQCEAGARFFDLRIDYNKQKSEHHQFKAHHTTAGIGFVGGNLHNMMKDLIIFLKENPQEFLIVRFSQCTGHEKIVDIIQQMDDHYGGQYLYKGEEAIAAAPIGALRGKIVAIFDSKFDHDPIRGIHIFRREPTNSPGLSIVGKYSNTPNAEKMVDNQLKQFEDYLHRLPDNETEASGQGKNHLYQLYLTQTHTIPANIRKATEKGAHQRVPTFMEELAQMEQPPNIILYDFVNEKTSLDIINLNFPKEPEPEEIVHL